MGRYTVFSVDMWGHVSADCCKGYGCPCVTLDDEGKPSHDDNACECHEDMNDRFRLGTVEASGTADLVRALHEAAFLSDEGRETCEADDTNGMGEDIDIRDREGRLIFYVEGDEDESASGGPLVTPG